MHSCILYCIHLYTVKSKLLALLLNLSIPLIFPQLLFNVEIFFFNTFLNSYNTGIKGFSAQYSQPLVVKKKEFYFYIHT